MEINYFSKYNIKVIFIKFLVFIFPFTLVSGPLIPDLIISISSLLFIVFFYKEFFFLVKSNPFIKIFFLFFIYLVINSFFSEVLLISLKSSLTYFRFVIFICLICYLYKNYPEVKYIFFLGLLLTFIILSIDANFQYVNGKNFFGFEPQKTPLRISGMFKDELILGSYLARLYPLLFGLFCLFFYKKKYFYLNIVILTVLVSFTIFISAERTSISLHFISITLLIFFINISKKYKVLIFLVLICGSILAISSNAHIKQRVIDQALFNSDNAKYVFSKVHHAHYLTSINIFIDKPILGSGIKTFRYLCDEEKYKVDRFGKPFGYWRFGCSTHPHNIYLQLLSETGVIGFMFLFLFFIYILVRLFRNLPEKGVDLYFKRTIYICLFINFFPFAPSGNFFNNYVTMMYILPITFMLLKLRKTN